MRAAEGPGEEAFADVTFQSPELCDQGVGFGLQVAGGAVEGREAHGDLEAVEAEPTVEGAFDGGSDVAGEAGVDLGHDGAAVHSWGPQGNLQVLEASADRLVFGAEFFGDVVGRALAGEVLLAQPGLVDGEGLAGPADGEAEGAGVGDGDVAGDAGFLGDVSQRLVAVDVLALQEGGGEDLFGLLVEAPGAEAR